MKTYVKPEVETVEFTTTNVVMNDVTSGDLEQD